VPSTACFAGPVMVRYIVDDALLFNKLVKRADLLSAERRWLQERSWQQLSLCENIELSSKASVGCRAENSKLTDSQSRSLYRLQRCRCVRQNVARICEKEPKFVSHSVDRRKQLIYEVRKMPPPPIYRMAPRNWHIFVRLITSSNIDQFHTSSLSESGNNV